jgi:hypothetical protein
MQLETVNKLYLELSQFATAKTANDLNLDRAWESLRRKGKLLTDIFNCDEVELLPVELRKRMNEELMGHSKGD